MILWEKFVADHQKFEDLKQYVVEWHHDISACLRLCSPKSETRLSFDGKLARLRELSAFRDEGFLRLEDAVSQSELVIRNTSANGRNLVGRSVLELRGTTRDLASSIDDQKEKCELAVLMHSEFSASVKRTTEWLRTVERETSALGRLPTDLVEQKFLLEKCRVGKIIYVFLCTCL